MPKSVFSKSYAGMLQLLVEARAEKGVTQASLASRLGKPQSFIAKIEGGERRIDVIEFFAIADALEIDALKLLTRLEAQLSRPLEI